MGLTGCPFREIKVATPLCMEYCSWRVGERSGVEAPPEERAMGAESQAEEGWEEERGREGERY